MRETGAARKARAEEILARLSKEYPDSACSLDFRNPFELLVMTVLSAQCTDETVNRVAPALFRAFPDPAALAGAPQAAVERLIHPTGFYRAKARNIRLASRALVEEHGGEVPRALAALIALPGVGRKTANVVLWNAFGIREGIAVDTHVTRLSGRLRLTGHERPQGIEEDLMRLVPEETWGHVTHLLIDHGRAVCTARKPRCDGCAVNDLCPSAFRV
ncbi:MAG: endonuclease III [Methanobacteriota archaeon]